MSDKKIRVLFICVHNSARSQMAEAFAVQQGKGIIEAESAGFTPTAINPLVVDVMAEKGLDLSGNTVDSALEFFREGRLYDYVITVCDESQAEKCPIFPGITARLHWSFPDPSRFEGTRETRLAKVREVRDAVETQVSEWIRGLGV
ncbi:MAG: arsenate reductase ArsC [Desulfatibacillaceae bacterium]